MLSTMHTINIMEVMNTIQKMITIDTMCKLHNSRINHKHTVLFDKNKQYIQDYNIKQCNNKYNAVNNE